MVYGRLARGTNRPASRRVALTALTPRARALRNPGTARRSSPRPASCCTSASVGGRSKTPRRRRRTRARQRVLPAHPAPSLAPTAATGGGIGGTSRSAREMTFSPSLPTPLCVPTHGPMRLWGSAGAPTRSQQSNTDQQMSFRNRWSSSTSSRIASGSWSRCHRHSSRPALSPSPSGAAARAALIA